MGAGSAIFSAGLSAINDAYNIYANERARADQLSAQHKNEELLRESWARDDTSRQRMVNDLESAGLSKWLASGASPMTSSPVSLQSPGSTAFDGSTADAIHHGYQDILAGEQTREQTETLRKQREAVDKSIEVQEAERKIKEQELRMKTHDADVLDSRGDTMSNDPSNMKYLAEILKTMRGDSSRLDGFGELYDRIKAERDSRIAEREKKKNEKRYQKYVEKKESVNEAKRKDKGNSWKPLSYVDWLRMNQLPANSGTLQSYRSYAERR